MKNENFELLLETMRLLKSNDQRGSTLGIAIGGVISAFDPSFSKEQKDHLISEFRRYISAFVRKRAEDDASRIEEEKYRELLEGFLNEEYEYSGGE